MVKGDLKVAGLVLLAGGAGGALCWVQGALVGAPWSALSSGATGALFLIFIGMAAGFIGVYLVANSDTSALLRTLALALSCGLFWQPVLEAGRGMILKTEAARTTYTAQRKLEQGETKIEQLRAVLEQPSGQPTGEVVAEATEATLEAVTAASQAPSPELKARANAQVFKLDALMASVAAEQTASPELERILKQNRAILDSVTVRPPLP